MEQYIKSKNIEANLIKVLSKRKKLVNDNFIEAFGLDELMKETLTKCKKAMKGEMKSVMTKNITEYLKKRICDENEYIRKYVYENINLHFISNYKYIKKDNEFIDYIVQLLGMNVLFFLEKNMNRESYNYLKKEEIESITNYLNKYKKYTQELIEEQVKIFSINFIDYQVKIEKNQNNNIELKNKRCIQEFRNTSTTFLNNNFYYIGQVHYILRNILDFWKMLPYCFEKQLNRLTEKILDQDNIQNLITECFLVKFTEFEKKCCQFFDKNKYNQEDNYKFKNSENNNIILNNKINYGLQNNNANNINLNDAMGNNNSFSTIDFNPKGNNISNFNGNDLNETNYNCGLNYINNNIDNNNFDSNNYLDLPSKNEIYNNFENGNQNKNEYDKTNFNEQENIYNKIGL